LRARATRPKCSVPRAGRRTPRTRQSDDGLTELADSVSELEDWCNRELERSINFSVGSSRGADLEKMAQQSVFLQGAKSARSWVEYLSK
jgi:hypothetical protein